MDIDYKIKTKIREFIESAKTLEDGQNMLRVVRNTPIANYNLKSSRIIWISLIIYKFKQEVGANDLLWSKSRNLIISILRNSYDIEQTMNEYIDLFSAWKKDDYIQFVGDIASFYYNLIEIKKSIELSDNEQTRSEWYPHYENLIQKVRNSCEKIGCLKDLDEIILTMETKKYDLVKEIMDKAYIDKLESDLDNGNMNIILQNLEELRTFLYEIKPRRLSPIELDEYFDINYIKMRIDSETFDEKYVAGLTGYIIEYLQSLDAIHFRKRYTETLMELRSLHGNRKIAVSLYKMLSLALDLKTRKGLWDKILSRE